MSPETTFYQEARRKFPVEPLAGAAQVLPLDELWGELSQAPYGPSLMVTTRFKQRFYFPQCGDSETIWANWVEPFSSLINHSRDFTQWSAAFHGLEGARFSPEEQMLGLAADAVHDLGEARVAGQDYVGDIMSGAKTDGDARREVVVAHAAIAALANSKLASWVPFLHRAYREVVAGENKRLHQAHKAREKWDYVRTALHLFALANTDPALRPPFQLYALDWFMARILAYDLPKITQEWANEYPLSLGNQLYVHADVLAALFRRAQFYINRVQTGDVPTKINDNFAELQEKIDHSYLLWRQWQENSQAGIMQQIR